jgi:hypothetical protein
MVQTISRTYSVGVHQDIKTSKDEDENRNHKMGKSMYNSAGQGKEKARQQKQMEKAAKRFLAKQRKTNLKTGTPNADSDMVEPGTMERIE